MLATANPIIHQELSLAPNLNVRDNIFMGREIRGPAGVNFGEEERLPRALMKELEQDIDPLTPLEELRLGQQQIVEIARALSVDSRILIMDEPTSALSATEVEVLFKVVRDLTAKGVSIVYISHHLEEALQITDHAVVLRDGAMTAYAPRSEIDLEWIVRNMVGENYNLGTPPAGYDKGGSRACASRNLSVPRSSGSLIRLVDRLSPDVRGRRSLCIYGQWAPGRNSEIDGVRRRAGYELRAGRIPCSMAKMSPGSASRSALLLACSGPRRSAARWSGPDHDGRPELITRQHWRLHKATVHFAQGRV